MDENLITQALEHLERFFDPSLGKIVTHEVLFQRKLVFSEVCTVKLFFRDCERNVVVKHLLEKDQHHPDPDRSLAGEFKTLQYLRRRFSDSENTLNVIRPLVLLPEEGVLVTEEFPGKKLQAVIHCQLRWRWVETKKGEIHASLSLCGKWLKRFQDFTQKKEVFLLTRDRYLEEIRGQLYPCDLQGVSPAPVDQILRYVDRVFGRIGVPELELVGYHSDFSTWNILVRNNEIRVLDFDRFNYRHKYDDLSFFLVTLEGEKSVIGMPEKTIEMLKDSFVDGYGKEHIDSNILELYIVKNLVKALNRINSSRSCHQRIVDRIYAEIRKRKHRVVLMRCLSDLIKDGTPFR